MQNKRMRMFVSLFLIFGLVLTSGTFSLAMNNPKEAASEEADVIYINGNIYTKYVAGENTNSKFDFWGPYGEYEKASVIATSDQDIIYVGNSQAEAEALAGDNPTIVDLGGKTVIPGLVESHMHFMSEGHAQTRINIFWKSKEDIISEVGKEAQRYADRGEPNTTWIVSGGWVDTLEGWTPATAAELDAVSLGYPVFLSHASGHGGWANTAAMEAAGLDKNTPDPVGGTIIRGADGNPTGLFQGGPAASLVSKHRPPYTEAQNIDALYAAQKECFEYGITTAMDAGNGVNTINLIKELYEDSTNPLKIRLYEEVSVDSTDPKNGSDEEFRANYNEGAPEIGLYGDRLTTRVCKIFMDGAMGSRTAAMIEPYEPYEDQGTGEIISDNTGNPRITPENLEIIIKQNLEAGFSTSAHAIGDYANRLYIDTLEKVMNELRETYKDTKPETFKGTQDEWKEWIEDPRPRTEHFQFLSMLPNGDYANDIEKAIGIGMTPSMQFIHATSDMNGAEPRLGPDRIKGAYAWRKILDAGGIIGNGTDASVELLNPYHGLYAGLTRQFRKEGGSPIGGGTPGGSDVGWYEEESLTIAENLAAYTIWGAYANFEEDIKGSLEVGKLADFVVLDRDIMALGNSDKSSDHRKIIDTGVIMTVLGGERVYFNEDLVEDVAEEADDAIAKATSSKVIVDGTEQSFEAYNIKGNNFFKLRDLALAVSGSEKQFEVSWNDEERVINLVSNNEYTVVGGEMALGDGVEKLGKLNTSKILKDGEEIALTAYNIGGNNYFKLRDIANAFDIGVTWDAETSTVGIDTSIGYVAP
ncbi:MAG TPA: amidohydrolase family protein [Thermoclostridium sp.]|nr:amidohydrolase family protein [Thermoclostridium sp.]